MEQALGLELEVPEKGKEKKSKKKNFISSFDGGEHGVSGFSLPTPPEKPVALLQRQGSVIPLAWSSSSSAADEAEGDETKAEKDPLLSVAAALGAPLALSAALECSLSTTSSSSCSASGSIFVDDGETDAVGDWWQLRARVWESGGAVEAELLRKEGEASSSSAAGEAFPLHAPPRLRKVSIAALGDIAMARKLAASFDPERSCAVRSELGEVRVVEVVEVKARRSTTATGATTAAAANSSSSSVATFEFPRTPSFLKTAGAPRGTGGRRDVNVSSAVITLVSWGDGGGGGSGVAEA